MRRTKYPTTLIPAWVQQYAVNSKNVFEFAKTYRKAERFKKQGPEYEAESCIHILKNCAPADIRLSADTIPERVKSLRTSI